jgi:hypothetical protein
MYDSPMAPAQKAWVVCILFAGVGVWSLLFHDVPNEIALPHALFYLVLTINSFYSIRFYSEWTPPSFLQSVVDGALVIAYIALALSIGLPTAFAFFALCIFVIAPMKYAEMLGKTSHDKTLRRKIMIDMLGTILMTAVLGGTLLGYREESVWVLTIIFALANVYFLMIRPMYRFLE